MPFVTSLSVAKVAMNFLWRSHATAMIFHVHKADGWATGQLADVTAGFGAWWDVQISNGLSQDLVIENITATDLTVADGQQDVKSDFTHGAGQVGSGSVNNSVALVVTWRTGLSGRSRRGRSYTPGIPTNELLDPNYVTDGYRDALLGLYQELILTDFGEDTVLGVLSLVSNGVPRGSGLFTPITEATMNSKLDNQRRRMRGAS